MNNAIIAADFWAGVIIGSAASGSDEGSAAFGDVQIRLQAVTFLGNDLQLNDSSSNAPQIIADNRQEDTYRAVFYSDNTASSVCVYEGPSWSTPPPECGFQATEPLSAASGFLNASSPWFLEVQEVCFH